MPAAPTDSERFIYDARGLLIEAEDRAAKVTLERDRNGRIGAESQNHRRITSVYDACGRRVERRIGFAAGWDPSGQAPIGFQGFTPADIAAGRIVTPYTLAPLSAPAADGITRYAFDPMGMLAELAFGAAEPGRPVQRLTFTRDALGRTSGGATVAALNWHSATTMPVN